MIVRPEMLLSNRLWEKTTSAIAIQLTLIKGERGVFGQLHIVTVYTGALWWFLQLVSKRIVYQIPIRVRCER